MGKSDKRVRARALMRVLCVVAEYGGMTPVTGVDKDQYLGFVGIPKPPVSAHLSHHVAHAHPTHDTVRARRHVHTRMRRSREQAYAVEGEGWQCERASHERMFCRCVCGATARWRVAARLHAAPGCLALHMA